MFLVELVMQGVRGIRELARLRFQGGFNIVAAGNESGKSSSVDAMLRLLFPANRPELLGAMISRHTPDASRAALVAFSDDGGYYRVIEDFSKQAINLSRYNATTKDFSLLYKDWDNTVQFMAGLTGGISEDDYARLFVVSRDRYAKDTHVQAAPVVKRQAAPTPVQQRRHAGNTPERQARLAQLREALRKSEEAADADYRSQSAKLKLDQIKKKLDSLAAGNQRAAELDITLAELEGCRTLPQNLNEMLEEHEQRQSQKMTKSDELNRDIQDLNLQLDTMPQMNLVKDQLFMLGGVIGAGSFIAGLFIPAEYSLYFPLGILVALVLVAIAWYKGSLKNTARKAVLKEVEGLQAELQELEKSFEQGGSQIAACMKATGSQTTAELKEKTENYRYFLSLRSELDEQQRAALGGQRVEDLQAEYEKQEQEVVALEKVSAEMSKYAIDAYSLRQDIERLEMEMGVASASAVDAPDLSEDVAFASMAPPSNGNGDGFLGELELASRIGDIEMETLVPAVVSAAQRNLASVSGGRYIRIDAAREGDPVVYAKDDSVVKISEMSHGTRELLFFCLRTGLAEALAGKRRLPLILDDPLAGLDPGRQQAACQILRTLGTKTQVILLTSNPGLKTAADPAVELK